MPGAGYVASITDVLSRRGDASVAWFGKRRTSAAQLLDRTGRIAGGLRAHGVAPGDRVAFLSANSDHVLALYLAIPWVGGVLTPLNCRWSGAENHAALEDCAPALLLVSAELARENAALLEQWCNHLAIVYIDDAPAGTLSLDDLATHDPIADAGRCGDDLLAIFYTGGTTGRPKGVMLSHAGLLQNCRTMRTTGMFPDDCRALVVAPLFHLAAAAELTMILLAGGTAVIEASFHPADTVATIARTGVTDALLVPTMVQMILDAPGFEPESFASVERIMYGASPMPEGTIDRIMAAIPHVRFTQAYGMTEASCTATLLPPDYHVDGHRAYGRHRAAGLPIAGTEVVVADEAGAPLPTGEVGEILIRGPGVMLGYWNQPEATAQALRNGWLHTGDGGRIDPDGLLYVVDRLKDMIVSGGENVFSAEVESAIARHAAVAQVAVIGVPDPRWGERVHAVVVPCSAGDAPDEQDIIHHCRALIAGYKCPRSVEFRAALPLSAAGKVVKAELRAPYWQGHIRNVA